MPNQSQRREPPHGNGHKTRPPDRAGGRTGRSRLHRPAVADGPQPGRNAGPGPVTGNSVLSPGLARPDAGGSVARRNPLVLDLHGTRLGGSPHSKWGRAYREQGLWELGVAILWREMGIGSEKQFGRLASLGSLCGKPAGAPLGLVGVLLDQGRVDLFLQTPV